MPCSTVTNAIDRVVGSNGPIGFADFIAGLAKLGIEAVPNVAPSTGRMNGFRFNVLKTGESYTGQDLGDDYKWTSLSARVAYDRDADRALAVQIKYQGSPPAPAPSGPAQSVEKSAGVVRPKVDLMALMGAVVNHARGMGCALEIAVRDVDIPDQTAWTRNWRVLAAGESPTPIMPNIVEMVASRHDVYAAPLHRDEGLVLLDDLRAEALAKLQADGLPPAAFLKTSPKKCQAWIRFGRRGDHDEFTLGALARVLATRYASLGADPNAARRGQLGRLAGTCNLKSAYLMDGRYPVVELLHADASARPNQSLAHSLIDAAAAKAAELRTRDHTSASDKTCSEMVERYLRMTRLPPDRAAELYREGELRLVAKDPGYYLKADGTPDNSRLISAIATYHAARAEPLDEFARADIVAVLINNPRAKTDHGYLIRMGLDYAISKVCRSGVL
jgi:hypothetical protein